MKHATAILVLALYFSLSAVAQTDNAVPDLHTHEGTISSGIYTNAFFEFSVEIPTGWKVVDNARYEALNNKSREEAAKKSRPRQAGTRDRDKCSLASDG